MNKTHKPKTLPLILFGRAFKESFVNLWRNKVLSLAAITVITIIAMIFNILLAINTSAKKSLEEFGQKVDMILYLKNDIEYHNVKNILDDLMKVEGVTDAKYTSKKEAMEKLAGKYPKLTDFFSKFEVENPLPASINIKTKHPSNSTNILKFIEKSRYADLFEQNEKTDETRFISGVASNLKKITETTERILYFMLVAFVIGGTLIIFNAIKLTVYARRKEIEVMKLVGASRFLIKLPFVLEGIWCFTIAVIINFALWDIIVSEFEFTEPSIKFYALAFELIAGIIIAAISGTLASTKHLNA